MTAVGGSGLGDNGCTATEMLPMVAESGVPLESSPFSGGGRSVQMPCPSCDLAPTRAGAELAGKQQQQQQQPPARPPSGATEMWGLERAVAAGKAAWGGGGEWLGLLRKRRRSAGNLPW